MANAAGTSRFDATDYLKTDKDIALYLEACLDEGDPALLVKALGNIARARGVTDVAQKVGMTRPGFYKAFGGEGNPSFETVVKTMGAMGMEFRIAPTYPVNGDSSAKVLARQSSKGRGNRAGREKLHAKVPVTSRRVGRRQSSPA